MKPANLRQAVKATLGTAVAVPLLVAALPASSAETELGNTTINVNGYVKASAVYNFEGDNGSSLGPSEVKDWDHKDGDTSFNANESRVNLDTATQTSVGEVTSHIEMDFAGDGDKRGKLSPRIRRAFLSWNGWDFGRDWTTFANFNYGEMLNFYGPAGQTFGRRGLVRYTFDFDSGDSFAVSLEDNGANAEVLDNVVPDNVVPDNVVPDDVKQVRSLPALAASYYGTIGEAFNYQASGYVGRLSARGTNTNVHSDSKENVTNWGVNLGGSYDLPTGTTLQLVGVYGEGLGRLTYSPVTVGSVAAYYDSNDKLQAYEQTAVVATVSQQLTEKLRTNVIYGFGQAEDDNDKKAKGQSVAVNLMYSPDEALTFGVEYNHVKNKTDNNFATAAGIDESANSVEFAAIYNF